MAELAYQETWWTGDGDDTPAISDLAVVWYGDAFVIVASSGAYGALTTWNWSGGNLRVVDQFDLMGDGAANGQADLMFATVGGVQSVVSFGGAVDGATQFRISQTGQISDRGELGTDEALFETALWIDGATGTYLLGATGAEPGMTLWERVAGGAMVEVDQAVTGLTTTGPDIPDMGHLTQNGRDYVVTLDLAGNSVSLHEIDGGGISRADIIGTADGMPTNAPTELEIVQFAGHDYAIIAGAGSNSLTVLRIENGTLTLVDHIIDDLDTRFQGVGVLETTTYEGRAFVAVSGQDSGITLLTVLPGGQLQTLDTLVDQMGARLDDVTAIEFVEIDGNLKILATGEGWQGITMIDVNTGTVGDHSVGNAGADVFSGTWRADMLDGGGGNDTLYGGGGDDILIDGGGNDHMFGGDGADVFVFRADGLGDRINDFEVGIDSINLSLIGQAYSLDALDIQMIAGGARIEFLGERIDVMSADGSNLSPDIFTREMLFDVAHMSVEALPPENQVLSGANDSDLLEGGAGNDQLFGGRGADYLMGGGGHDFLNGGLVNATFDEVSAQVVRLFQATLGRTPAESGHTSWSNRILDGEITGQEAAAGFMNSREFETIYGDTTDGEFVTALFQNVLGREPGAAGLNGWTTNLGNGMAREDVVWLFSESQEFQNAMAQTALGFSAGAYQAGWTDDVYRLFLTTLGREPGPDGIAAWSENLANGMTFSQAIGAFVVGPEFQIVYGPTTDTEFVQLLFQNVLERPAGDAGLAGWVANLQAGMSRVDVVTNFAQSPEFVITSFAGLVDFMRTVGRDDTLDGGGGDDVLFGGALADEFIFNVDEGGSDTIIDFEVWDIVRLINSDYNAESEVLADLTQVGDDVVLDFGSGALIFRNSDVNDFDDDHFLF